MAGVIKLKMRVGRREIEIEGEQAEVEAILEKYWLPNAEADQPDDDEGTADNRNEGNSGKGRSGRSGSRRRSRSSPAPAGAGAPDVPDLNYADLANSIKNRADFGTIDKKALHDGSNWHKAAAVMWALDIPLSSGDLAKILHDLRANVSQPRISETLSREKKKLIKSKARRGNVTVDVYQLSGPTMTQVSAWLKEGAALDDDDLEGNAGDNEDESSGEGE